MKRFFKSIMLIAVSASALSACTEGIDETVGSAPSDKQLIELTISTAKPEAVISRTMVAEDGITPMWCVGDAIGVSVFANNVYTNDKFVNEATKEAVTTTFNGTTVVGETIYTYYPYSDAGVTENGKAQVVMPAVQHPTPTSFDGSADLLIGRPTAITSETTEIEGLQFKRVGGMLKIILKDNTTNDIITGQKVESLSVTAESNLAGSVYLDIVNGELGDIYDNATTTVTAEYDDTPYVIGDDKAGGYLGVYPQTLAEGTKLTISVVTEQCEIERTITLPTDVEIEACTITSLTISISDDDFYPTDMELMFPDPNFRQYVLGRFDSNKDGKISQEEALEVTWIICDSKAIKSLEGVQYFTNLTSLYCDSNQLTDLDVSQNTALTSLTCNFNKLTSLNVSGCTALTSLTCNSNQLTSLNVSGCTALTSLTCDYNQLTSLEVSQNTALTTLKCDSNQLTNLNVSGCSALTDLYCNFNNLTTLEVSGCTALTSLNCNSNQLTSLNVSGCTALTSLYCWSNQLTNLNVSSCTALTTLYCRSNQLTDLDVSQNTALTSLTCNSNQLTSLNVSGCTALTSLTCDYNQLTSLDVSQNTALTTLKCDSNQLTNLNVSGCSALTDLYCNFNNLTTLEVSGCTALTSLNCNSNQLTSLNVSGCTALTYLRCYSNQLTSLDVSKTNLGNSTSSYPLDCSPMPTLKTLTLKNGWSIKGITENNGRSTDYIPLQTEIVYVD